MATTILALRNNAEAFRTNLEGYTSEVRYTDEILEFSELFGPNTMYPDAITALPEPNPALLHVTATGEVGDVGYFPLNAVRWLRSPREITALVVDSGRDHFSAELLQFGMQRRAVARSSTCSFPASTGSPSRRMAPAEKRP